MMLFVLFLVIIVLLISVVFLGTSYDEVTDNNDKLEKKLSRETRILKELRAELVEKGLCFYDDDQNFHIKEKPKTVVKD